MKITFLFFVSLVFCAFSHAVEVPPGYVLQILNPTGGKVARPSDWFYSEAHTSSVSFRWLLSKEDPTKGPYDTGLSIQSFAAVKKGTGKTAQEFCASFLEDKETQSKQMIRKFPEASQGMFKRTGIEVEEVIEQDGKAKMFHIVYSVFWAQDIAVITTAGAPVESWGRYQKIFNVMSNFEFIDMSHFLEKARPPKKRAAQEPAPAPEEQ